MIDPDKMAEETCFICKKIIHADEDRVWVPHPNGIKGNIVPCHPNHPGVEAMRPKPRSNIVVHWSGKCDKDALQEISDEAQTPKMAGRVPKTDAKGQENDEGTNPALGKGPRVRQPRASSTQG